ncbi:MAG: 3'-5' exonuclease [Elusimicrobia bacterium]|nr:3'-5' exonuclease [Elusimicrobiota bacterium]
MIHTMLDQTIDSAIFNFIDVETTGLSPDSARVCEVALIGFKGDARVNHFSSLVNPGGPIPHTASRINGITDDMVRSSPVFEDVAPKLLDLLEGSVIVAHNAPFDTNFLKMEFSRVGLKFPDLLVVDTLEIARGHYKFTNNRLGTIAGELNLSSEHWHRALADVEMTRKIFEHFVSAFKNSGAVTVGDLVNKCRGIR